MKTRQGIILAAAGILALYTAYTYLAESPSDSDWDRDLQAGELTSFVEETSRMLAAGKLTEQETYGIGRAESPWPKDPFFAPVLETKKEVEEDIIIKDEFIYSGFLESGSTRIAIINGLEYEAGESLREEGYVLQGISPERVVIGIMGKKQTFSIPFSE